MDKELRAKVREKILKAEDEFNRRMIHLEGFEMALMTLESLEKARNERIEKLEDASGLTSLLEESKDVLNQMMEDSRSDKNLLLDFAAFAEQVASDMRNQESSAITAFSLPSTSGEFLAQRSSAHGPGSVKSFLHILQANGKLNEEMHVDLSAKDRQKYQWASYIAWTIAVIGMIIALAFLTRDFYTARVNFALNIVRKNETVPYPALTICSHTPGVPFFSEYPTKEYPGVALIGISQIKVQASHNGTALNINYPDTLKSEYVEKAMTANTHESCAAKEAMDLHRDKATLFRIGDFFEVGKESDANVVQCFWCLRVGGASKVMADDEEFANSGLSSPPYQVTFFKSKFIYGCRSNAGFRDVVVRRGLLKELEVHTDELIKRGILDFTTHAPGTNRYDALKRPILHGFNHNAENGLGDHIAATIFACNIYFYSGYFYPTETPTDVRYRYEDSNKSWVESGQGPYYRPLAWPVDAPALIGPGHRTVENDLYSTDVSYVLIENPDIVRPGNGSKPGFVDFTNKISHVEANIAQAFTLERRNRQGVIEYRTEAAPPRLLRSTKLPMQSFSISLAYKSGLTEYIDSIATESWSQYMTDVFEFIGLFTGVCVFTMLVAPAHSLATAAGGAEEGENENAAGAAVASS